MAKPARAKKKEATAPPKKGEKSASKGKANDAAAKSKVKDASAKGKPKDAAAKGKVRAAEKAKTGGLRGRVARSQAKQSKQGKAAKGPRENKTVKFFREVKVELSKVTWPTREELIQSTIVVVIAVVIAGTFIEIFDLIFSKLVNVL